MQMLHREPAAVVEDHRDGGGERAERPDDDPVRSRVRAEHGVRVVMLAGDNLLDFAQGEFVICHVYNSAIDSSGMDSQVGRFLASYMTS